MLGAPSGSPKGGVKEPGCSAGAVFMAAVFWIFWLGLCGWPPQLFLLSKKIDYARAGHSMSVHFRCLVCCLRPPAPKGSKNAESFGMVKYWFTLIYNKIMGPGYRACFLILVWQQQAAIYQPERSNIVGKSLYRIFRLATGLLLPSVDRIKNRFAFSRFNSHTWNLSRLTAFLHW